MAQGDAFALDNPAGTELFSVDSSGNVVAAGSITASSYITGDALTLTAAAESSDTIAVTVAGPAAAAQYIATLYDSAMLLSLVGAFTIAETGDGAEVSTTGKPRLLFTTSAAGAATLTVTDVATGSGATVYLEVRAAAASAGTEGGATAIIALTFD